VYLSHQFREKDFVGDCVKGPGRKERRKPQLPFPIPLHCLRGGGRTVGSEAEPE